MQMCIEIMCASHVEASQITLIGCRSSRSLSWRERNIVIVRKGWRTKRDGKIAEGRSFQSRNQTGVGKLATRATSFPFFLSDLLYPSFALQSRHRYLSLTPKHAFLHALPNHYRDPCFSPSWKRRLNGLNDIL